MRETAAARRYARAVFEIAQSTERVEIWQSDLAVLETVLSEPQVEAFLLNPRFDRESKRRLIRDSLARSVGEMAVNLACQLVSAGRLGLLGAVRAEYLRLLSESRGTQKAVVTTAVPLDEQSRLSVSASLSRYSGKQIEMDERVDPAVLGGLIARIGDRLLDGSVRTGLGALRRLMAGAG